MKKIKLKIILKLTDIGLFVMNLGDKSEYDSEDWNHFYSLKKMRMEAERELEQC